MEHLPPAARSLIEASVEECWLSPISVWEAGILRDRGEIHLEGDFRSWVEESRRRLPPGAGRGGAASGRGSEALRDEMAPAERPTFAEQWRGRFHPAERNGARRFLAGLTQFVGLAETTTESLRTATALPSP